MTIDIDAIRAKAERYAKVYGGDCAYICSATPAEVISLRGGK